MPPDAVWLRHVPVSFALAPVRVESEIMRLRPRAVICCGMAEKRQRLSIERQAKRFPQKYDVPNGNAPAPVADEQVSILQTTMDVRRLMTGTVLSEVSEDAGAYVCNDLYYNVLKLVDQVSWEMAGVFIHIPVVNPNNKTFLLQDFFKIVSQISACD